MERILERHERHSYAEQRHLPNDNQTCGSWTLEYGKLKARIEVLHKNLRHYNGEDIDSLNLRELQNLEQQLDSALKHIRSKKNQVMSESISELQKKDKSLQEQNSQLAKKVKEREKEIISESEQQAQQDHPPSHLLPRQHSTMNALDSQSSAPAAAAGFVAQHPFGHHLDHISGGGGGGGGGYPARGGEEEGSSSSNHRGNALLPAWMMMSHQM